MTHITYSVRDSLFFDLAVAIERGDKAEAFRLLDQIAGTSDPRRNAIEQGRFSFDARRSA